MYKKYGNKEFSYDDKLDYHSARSHGGRFTNSLKVEYSRNWLLGATYAESLTDNGNKLFKARNDKYVNDRRKGKKFENNAFVNGFDSFVNDCKKNIPGKTRYK